jgi:putative membrane protein
MILLLNTQSKNLVMKILYLCIVAGGLFTACGNHNPSGDVTKTQKEKQKLIGDTSDLSKEGSSSAGGSSSGTQSNNGNDTAKGGVSRSADFYRVAIEGNLAEIRMAKLALNKSSNADIKQIANHLVKDHSNFLKQLKAIADSSAKADTTISTDAATALRDLSSASGKVFDNKWLDVMIAGHDKTIGLYESTLPTANDKMKNFLEATLPLVKDHKKMLLNIKQKS